jgi:hypothetical protein
MLTKTLPLFLVSILVDAADKDIYQCPSDKKVKLKFDMPTGDGFFFVMKAKVSLANEYLALNHFSFDIMNPRLEALIDYVRDNYGTSLSTEEEYTDAIKSFEAENPLIPDFVDVTVSYISNDKATLEYEQNGQTYSFETEPWEADTTWGVGVLNPWDYEQFTVLTDDWVDAIFKRQPGPYQMLIHDVFITPYEEG